MKRGTAAILMLAALTGPVAAAARELAARVTRVARVLRTFP